ncbi:MAG: polysaccharide pyruvyl transferase family protein [Steroidobacteraceae bacterium]
MLRAAGVPAGKPLIGVSPRRRLHRRGDSFLIELVGQGGLDRGHGEATMQDFIRQVATSVRRMAAELDAAVLLLPSYNVGHEADDRVAARFRGALGDAESHLLVLDDPALYKAVTGMLSLLVSSRMHPLIFAASMGVPIVGLGYNPKFAGLFGQSSVSSRD